MNHVNPFESAMKQLDKAAKYLQEDKEYIALLRSPQRQVEASVPVRMDSGELRILQSYRVQFDNHRGPYKGGIRFHQDTDIDEVKALAFWMAIKTATVNIPLGGGKGGVTVNPKELSEAELERLARGWTRAMKPVIGPDKDIPAPDVMTGICLGLMVVALKPLVLEDTAGRRNRTLLILGLKLVRTHLGLQIVQDRQRFPLWV